MNVIVGRYHFNLALLKEGSERLSYRKPAVESAKQTLQLLPVSIFRKYLNPNVAYGLNLVFVNRRQIRRLNARYRNKNKPTDVLSFSQVEAGKFPGEALEVGDVVICTEVGEENARRDGIPASEEIQRLVIHGILHLFGYDHVVDKKEAKKMFRLQNKILKRSLGRDPSPLPITLE